jgi:cell division control protein 6
MNPFSKYINSENKVSAHLELLNESFIPDSFPHREEEIQHLVDILSSVIRNTRPSNILIYGKTGTGKTSTTRHVISLLKEATNDRVTTCYLNCQVNDTPYSVLTTIVNGLSDAGEKIPLLGWTTDRIYGELVSRINGLSGFVIIILDEIDKLVEKSGGDSLYVVLKILEESTLSKVSIIGITNDTNIMSQMEPRIKSRMNQESLIFPPYNATQLKDILKFRLRGVTNEGLVDEGAISLCAAIGAQENGDARKVINLMRIAIEIAERNGCEKVTEKEVYAARDKFEMDVVKETILTLPLHNKIILLSTIVTQELSDKLLITGEIMDNYRAICNELGFQALTSRRASDILSELEELGLVITTTKSLGRYGRTRFVRINGDLAIFKKYVLEDDNLSLFKGKNVTRQARFDNISGEERLTKEGFDEFINKMDQSDDDS